MTPTQLALPDLQRRARRHVALRFGWMIHAIVFVVFNAGLIGLSALTGKHWAIYPLLGWGVGLAAHGLAVWLATSGFTQRMEAAELQRLQAQQGQEPRA